MHIVSSKLFSRGWLRTWCGSRPLSPTVLVSSMLCCYFPTGWSCAWSRPRGLCVASKSLLKSEIVRQRLEVILLILVSLIAMGAKAEQSMQELRDFVASVECDGMRFFVSLVWAVAKLVFFCQERIRLGTILSLQS